MRNRELYIAFCFSLAAHGALVGVCSSPRADSAGQSGSRQDMVVFGIARVAPSAPSEPSPRPRPEPVEPEQVHPIKNIEHRLPESTVQLSRSEPEDNLPAVPKTASPAAEKETPLLDAGEDEPGKLEITAGRFEDVRTTYLRSVMRRLEQAKQFPAQAHRLGLEGTAEIEFTILADGSVSEIERRLSSGHPVLDSAAADLVDRARPFDPIPVELGMTRMRVVAPISYSIER